MLNADQISFLSGMLGRAQALAAAVLTGDDAEAALLCEEVSGELSEFIEHLEGHSRHMDSDAIDPLSQSLAHSLNGMEI